MKKRNKLILGIAMVVCAVCMVTPDMPVMAKEKVVSESENIIYWEDTLKTGEEMEVTVPAGMTLYVPFVVDQSPTYYYGRSKYDYSQFMIDGKCDVAANCTIYRAETGEAISDGDGVVDHSTFMKNFSMERNNVQKGDLLYIAVSCPEAKMDAKVTLFMSFNDVIVENVSGELVDVKYIGVGKIVSVSMDRDKRTVRKVTFDEGFTYIAGFSVWNIRNELTELSFPASVKYVEGAFNEHQNLKKVTFAEGTKDVVIGRYAFADCTALEEVNLPNLADIGYGSFSGCTSLKKVTWGTVPDGYVVPESLFSDCAIAEMTLPDNIGGFYYSVFRNCANLKEITIPDSVTTIGNAAFLNCTGLETVYMSSNIESIDMSAFENCDALKNVFYAGKTSDWEKVTVESYGNKPLLNTITPAEKADQSVIYSGDTTIKCDQNRPFSINAKSTGTGKIVFSVDHPESVQIEEPNIRFDGVGAYTLTIKALGNNLYNESEPVVIQVISRGPITDDMYKVPSPTYAVYDGKEHALIIPETCEYGYFVYSLDGENYTENVPTAIEPGTYKIYFRVVSTNENYSDSSTRIMRAPIVHDHSYAEEVVAPTCTENGYTIHTCICGDSYKDQETPAAHKKVTKVTKATLSADGKEETKCSVCGKIIKTKTIYRPKSFILAKDTYVYDGKTKKPAVTVKDSKGNVIANTNYSVKYDGGRKNVGKYNVEITFKGNYKGSKSLTFVINPKATTLKSVTPASKAFTATWTKQTTQVDGYEVEYALDQKFTSGAKKVEVTKNSTTSKKISNLKSKKTYYVRVRTYKKVGTKKYYSDWSKTLNVKTK